MKFRKIISIIIAALTIALPMSVSGYSEYEKKTVDISIETPVVGKKAPFEMCTDNEEYMSGQPLALTEFASEGFDSYETLLELRKRMLRFEEISGNRQPENRAIADVLLITNGVAWVEYDEEFDSVNEVRGDISKCRCMVPGDRFAEGKKYCCIFNVGPRIDKNIFMDEMRPYFDALKPYVQGIMDSYDRFFEMAESDYDMAYDELCNACDNLQGQYKVELDATEDKLNKLMNSELYKEYLEKSRNMSVTINGQKLETNAIDFGAPREPDFSEKITIFFEKIVEWFTEIFKIK